MIFYNNFVKLRESGVSYQKMADFSLVSIPFTVKVLYCGFIDSTFITKIGRRKTWIAAGHLGVAVVSFIFYLNFQKWLVNQGAGGINL